MHPRRSAGTRSGDRTRASTRDGALPHPSHRASLVTRERSRSPAPRPATSTSPAALPPATPATQQPRTTQQLQKERARQKEKRLRKRQKLAQAKAAAPAATAAPLPSSQQLEPQPQPAQQAPTLLPPSSATGLQLRKPPLHLRVRRDGSLPRQQQRAGRGSSSNSRAYRIARRVQPQPPKGARSGAATRRAPLTVADLAAGGLSAGADSAGHVLPTVGARSGTANRPTWAAAQRKLSKWAASVRAAADQRYAGDIPPRSFLRMGGSHPLSHLRHQSSQLQQ